MTNDSPSPDDPGTPLATAATTLHELYLEFVRAGFTEAQALYLTGQQVRAMNGGNS